MSETPTQRLIAELERGAGEGEAGAWTLDEAAARRKLAEYRLADPHVWLCTIVEAAVLLGAWTIRIERSVDALRIEFNGLAPPLDGLFGAVFAGSSGDPRTRAARKLAIAFETMLERAEVASIEVEAGHERLTLTKDARGIATREPLGMTSIVVQRGLSWPELDELAERGRYARASIHVSSMIVPEAEPLSRGLEQALVDAEATRARWPISQEGKVIGWLGHRPYADLDSKLVLVSDGIVAETLALHGKGEVVVVECSLAKDLGENKVLRDTAFERVRALVEAARAEHPHVPVVAEPAVADVAAPTSTRRADSSARARMILISVAFVVVFWMMFRVSMAYLLSAEGARLHPSAAILRGQIALAETFATCETRSLPGRRLTQLRVMVYGPPNSPRASVLELNYDFNFHRHERVARCIETRVSSLAAELAKRNPAAWDGLHLRSNTWILEY